MTRGPPRVRLLESGKERDPMSHSVKFCTAKDVSGDRCTVVEVFTSDQAAMKAARGELFVFEVSHGESVKPGDRAFIGGATGTVWS